jgi:hypothetical protein
MPVHAEHNCDRRRSEVFHPPQRLLTASGTPAARAHAYAWHQVRLRRNRRVTLRNWSLWGKLSEEPGGQRKAVQSILHDEAGRGRDRARPVYQSRHHRQTAFGVYRDRVAARRVYRGPHCPAAGGCVHCRGTSVTPAAGAISPRGRMRSYQMRTAASAVRVNRFRLLILKMRRQASVL